MSAKKINKIRMIVRSRYFSLTFLYIITREKLFGNMSEGSLKSKRVSTATDP